MRRYVSIVWLVLAGLALPAQAQTDLALMTTPWRAASPIDGGGSVLFLPTQVDEAGGDDVDLSLVRYAGRFRPDLEHDQKFTLAIDQTYLGIETGDALLPERLNNTAIAAGLLLGSFEAFEKQWEWGGSVGVGHASSNPFGDGSGWYGLGSVFAQTRLDETSSLMIGVDFNGNRAIFPDLPLPAFVYTTRYSDQLTFALGLPINTLRWTPDEFWTVQLAVAGIAFSADVELRLDDAVSLFAAYGGDGEGFHVADDDSDQRLFYSAQVVEAGLRYGVTERSSLVIAGGFAFDQEFERGFDLRDTDTVRELDNTAYFRLGGRLEF
ncbi:MAG: hypothetical protein AAF328_11040 [Planctomycetota bacterium]